VTTRPFRLSSTDEKAITTREGQNETALGGVQYVRVNLPLALRLRGGRRRVVIVAAGFVTLAALAASCRHEKVESERDRPVVVAVSRPHGGKACHPRLVAGVVLDLFDAINRGDEKRLDRLFPRLLFDWYAVDGETGRRSSEIVDPTGRSNPYDRDNLLAYFRDRHERDEHLRLVELRVNFANIKTELADGEPIPPTLMAAVEARLLRAADDFQASDAVPYHAKALIACQRRAASLWAMGPEEGLRLAPLCPEPRSRPIRAVVTC
jgi:hypothetical protein